MNTHKLVHNRSTGKINGQVGWNSIEFSHGNQTNTKALILGDSNKGHGIAKQGSTIGWVYFLLQI